MSRKGTTIFDERADMAAKGYIQPKQAAEELGVSLNWPYRAMLSGEVPCKMGANGRSRYIHRERWLAWAKAKQAAELERIGVRRGR